VPSAVVGARLDAWIDWNADDDWDDSGEQIFTNQIIGDGDNSLQVQVPANAAPGQTYARFRLSSAGNLQPTGLSDSGEVEDWATVIGGAFDYDIEPREQLFIYELNRARSDPQAYETENALSVSFADIDPQPPLAVNPYLVASSRFHSNEMAKNDYFAHTSEVTGDQPNKMALDAGYPLPFSPNANNIESIAAGFGQGAIETASGALRLLLEDLNVNPPGHRQHLLAMNSFMQQHREIGVGFANNNSSTFRNYWAAHTAHHDNGPFLTGVVYGDQNSNDLYDLNEGLSGVTVSTNPGTSVMTNATGGWSLEVTPGTYIVSASGGSYSGTGSSVVFVSDSNVEVDFTSGEAAGVVGFGVPEPNDEPSFTASDPLAVDEGAGSQTVVNWATGFNPGPPDEQGQNLAGYTVSNISSAGLFATPPAVTGNGTLTYTPADDVSGTSTFEVTVQDDGGTANGGNDTSLPQTITVTVNAFERVTIAGMKFEDQDGDGVKDQGEPGLSDWTIQLQDGNGQLITTATTDVSGDYGFNDLGPGTYRVREVQQTGWTQTTANPSDIVTTSGDDVSGVDFGNGNFELPLDVDGNSTPAALTDGLLIIRYLAGFRGQALISGAVAPDATRTTAEQIEAFLEETMPAYNDVDDSGSALVLTDGLLIIRFLAGFTGAALVADATAGPRSDPADIVAFLDPFLAPQAQQGLAGPADDQTHDALAEMSSLLLQFDDSRSVRQGSAAIDHTQVGAARFAG
ncbi:MAG: SdrD B-like domain-containing protein, partial [Phycisphaeraceae bacterium]|nr:SdrD B-like domain-containing protein [Phycisphaeraceae bacterium]